LRLESLDLRRSLSINSIRGALPRDLFC